MIYLDKTDSSKAKLADCDASAATKEAVGMVICASAKAGQHVTYAKPGAVVAMAHSHGRQLYALSDVAGAVRPVADNGSGRRRRARRCRDQRNADEAASLNPAPPSKLAPTEARPWVTQRP